MANHFFDSIFLTEISITLLFFIQLKPKRKVKNSPLVIKAFHECKSNSRILKLRTESERHPFFISVHFWHA